MSDRQSPVRRLDERMVAANRSGMGITSHAHPEFEKPTSIDNVVAAAKSFWARMHGQPSAGSDSSKTAPPKAPATTPKPAPAPKPASTSEPSKDSLTTAQEDSLSKRFLGK
jgi:hypothetical protein